LEAKIAHIEKRNAELESELAKAKKNSGNSSKPPSTDIVKPQKPHCLRPAGKGREAAKPATPNTSGIARPPSGVPDVASIISPRYLPK
jgi:hypothetical protein